MSLSTLPPELYECVLSHVPKSDLRRTILSLTRILPNHLLPLRQLFQDIHITRPEQIIQLYRRFRERRISNADGETEIDPALGWVQSFALETWTADAEIVLNLLSLLPNLQTLTIWIGPTNFLPEHLEELFDIERHSKDSRCLQCVGTLRYLSLRFRPYVQEATYYQFMSGAYFDPTLNAISRWPKAHLPTLSIVQDPMTIESQTSAGSEPLPPPSFSFGLPKRTLRSGFAQPIVFFQLESTIPELLRSPGLRLTLKSLRIRLPGRNITQALTRSPPPQPPSFGAPIAAGSDPDTLRERYYRLIPTAHLTPSPHLTFLDASTTLVTENHVQSVIARYPALSHIVLDDCALLLGDSSVRDRGREWGVLSHKCASAGVDKAKEREKKVANWLAAQLASLNATKDKGQTADRENSPHQGAPTPPKIPRRGRRGLASATISLRTENPTPTVTSQSAVAGSSSIHLDLEGSQRIRILPPVPTLQSLTTTLVVPASFIPEAPEASNGTAPLDPQIVYGSLLADIQSEWERGWAEGISLLVKRRGLIKASWRNKLVRVMRYQRSTETGKNSSKGDGSVSPSPSRSTISDFEDDQEGEGLAGLVEVEHEEEFDVDVTDTGCGRAPALCLAGTGVPSGPNPSLSGVLRGGGRVVRGLAHADGCAHETGRKIWVDKLV